MNKGTLQIIIPLVVIVAAVLYYTVAYDPVPPPPPQAKAVDFSEHPIYKDYVFNKSAQVINFGSQPLLMPTGLFSETMRRDRILHRELKKLQMTINFLPFLKGFDLNHFLAKRQLDVVVAGDMPTVVAATTIDIVVPAVIQKGFTAIVGKTPMKVLGLKGKRVGNALGSNAHYGLLQALASVGMTDEDIEIVPLDVTSMPEALLTSKIDAFSSFEPTPAIALNMVPGSAIVHRNMSFGFIYFDSSFARAHPEVVKHIIAAEVRALLWMQADPGNLHQAASWSIQGAAPLSDKKFELSVEQVVKLATSDIIGSTTWPAIPDDILRPGGRLEREFNLLTKLGKLPATSSWRETKQRFNTSILEEIRENKQLYYLDQTDYSESDDIH